MFVNFLFTFAANHCGEYLFQQLKRLATVKGVNEVGYCYRRKMLYAAVREDTPYSIISLTLPVNW